MKTSCFTSSTTIMTTTRETLNLFDSHHCSTSALKTLTTATTIPANILTTTTSILSTTPVVSILIQPTVSKISTISAVELLIANDKIKLMELDKKLDQEIISFGYLKESIEIIAYKHLANIQTSIIELEA
ncbi:unnamed protein product [Rotaria sp. Silwood1]|nr:unnamed protein product [Rotaria sp. Silwood1]